MKSQILEITNEKDILSSTFEQNKVELNKLQAELKRANSELQQQTNHIKRLETQQKDFVNQNRHKSQEIKRLEDELEKFDELKKENKRINAYGREVRKKSERCEEELKSMKQQCEQFDAFVESMRQNKSFKIPNNQLEMTGPLSKTMNKLMDHLREVESQRKWNQELIKSLESKVSELQFNKTSLERQLSQASVQVSELEKKMQEKSNNETTLGNEFRMKSQLVEMLEDRLKEVHKLLKDSQAKCLHVENLMRLETESRTFLENQAEETKHQLAVKCSALEELKLRERSFQEAFEMMKAKLETSEENFSRSESRCSSLQRSLDEIVEATRSLKSEIQQSDEKKQEFILTLEKELWSRSEECNSLRRELENIKENLKYCNKTQEDDLKACHKGELEAKEKAIRSLKDKLEQTSSSLARADQEIENLKKESEENKTAIQNKNLHIEFLEKSKETLQHDLERTEKSKSKEVESFNVELEKLKEELRLAVETLSAKEEVVRSLTEEKSRTSDEEKQTLRTFGTEMEKILKDLKEERKKSHKLQMECDAILNEREQLLSSIESLRSSHRHLKDDHWSLEIKYESENKRSRSLDEKVSKLKSRLKSFDIEHATSQKQAEEFHKEVEILKKELMIQKMNKNESIQEANQCKARIANLEEALEKTSADLHEKSSTLVRLASDAKEETCRLRTKIKDLELELEKKNANASVGENLVAALEEQVRQLSGSLKESLMSRQLLSDKYKFVKADLQSSEASLEDMKNTLASSEQGKQEIIANFSKMEDQLDHYKIKCNELHQEMSSIREELLTKKEENLRIMTEVQDKRMLLTFRDQKIKELEKLTESLNCEKSDEEKRFQMVEGSLRLRADKSRAELLEVKQEKSTQEEEMNLLKKKLQCSEIQQHKLTQELKRVTSDLGSLRTELEASRAVTNASRESLLVKDLELKKLASKMDNLNDQKFLRNYPSSLRSSMTSIPQNLSSNVFNPVTFEHLDSLLPSRDIGGGRVQPRLTSSMLNLSPPFYRPNVGQTAPRAEFKSLASYETTESPNGVEVPEENTSDLQNIHPPRTPHQQNISEKPKWR